MKLVKKMMIKIKIMNKSYIFSSNFLCKKIKRKKLLRSKNGKKVKKKWQLRENKKYKK